MSENLIRLNSWLSRNGFTEEAEFLADMVKSATGRPMPIDQSEMESIADDLLAELKAKFMAYPEMSALELYSVIDGSAPIDNIKIRPTKDLASADEDDILMIVATEEALASEASPEGKKSLLKKIISFLKNKNPEKYGKLTIESLGKEYAKYQEQRLVDFLESSVNRSKKDIRGDDIDVTYRIMFSDVAQKPEGTTAQTEGSNRKEVIIGINPNRSLLDAVRNHLEKNNYGEDVPDNRVAEADFFIESIRPYVISILMHEEAHVLDVFREDKKRSEEYEVSGDNETIRSIAERFQVNEESFFVSNLLEIMKSMTDIDINKVHNAVTDLSSGSSDSMLSLLQLIKDRKLEPGIKLRIPPRSHRQVRVSRTKADEEGYEIKTKTLQNIADDTGLKHGVLRLIVVNYNNLFANKLAVNSRGDTLPSASSYQQVYDYFSGNPMMLDAVSNMELPEGEEVKLVPSFSELYSYDRGFYYLTQEEIKAFISQSLNELRTIFKDDFATSPHDLSSEDLFDLSDQLSAIKDALKVQPVDEILKTPIGYMDRLKRNRMKVYESGVRHIHEILKSEFSEDLEKSAVLKKKLRTTRGKGKRDRKEWGLFSKKKPKKVLKWFGPKKPSKKQIAKEEARIHAFS